MSEIVCAGPLKPTAVNVGGVLTWRHVARTLARADSSEPLSDNPFFRRMLRRLCPTARSVLIRRSLRALHLAGIRRALVVGAGDDPYRHIFRDAETYVRLDLVRVPRLTDVVADAAVLPFEGASFECALVTEVLEYLRDPSVFASELRRVLVHGGLAVITVPFIFHEHHDYWRPARRALADVFRDFSHVRICAQGNRLHTMFDLLTTTFSPVPVLFPLRVFSNLLFLLPARIVLRDSTSTAPTGFLVLAEK
jgi:SAM-dependent methyltransferase